MNPTPPPIGPVPEPGDTPTEMPMHEPVSPVHPRPEPPEPATPEPQTVPPEPVSPVHPRPVPPDPNLPQPDMPDPDPVERRAAAVPFALSLRIAYHLAHGRMRAAIRHRLGARRLPV